MAKEAYRNPSKTKCDRQNNDVRVSESRYKKEGYIKGGHARRRRRRRRRRGRGRQGPNYSNIARCLLAYVGGRRSTLRRVIVAIGRSRMVLVVRVVRGGFIYDRAGLHVAGVLEVEAHRDPELAVVHIHILGLAVAVVVAVAVSAHVIVEKLVGGLVAGVLGGRKPVALLLLTALRVSGLTLILLLGVCCYCRRRRRRRRR
jgi:hypothetical protein